MQQHFQALGELRERLRF